jgi:hypothetical protein
MVSYKEAKRGIVITIRASSENWMLSLGLNWGNFAEHI